MKNSLDQSQDMLMTGGNRLTNTLILKPEIDHNQSSYTSAVDVITKNGPVIKNENDQYGKQIEKLNRSLVNQEKRHPIMDTDYLYHDCP